MYPDKFRGRLHSFNSEVTQLLVLIGLLSWVFRVIFACIFLEDSLFTNNLLMLVSPYYFIEVVSTTSFNFSFISSIASSRSLIFSSMIFFYSYTYLSNYSLVTIFVDLLDLVGNIIPPKALILWV